MNIEKIFPDEFISNKTSSGQALIDNIQSEQDLIESGIMGLDELTNPYKCPVEYLDVLAFEKGIRLNVDDSERIKRDKIANANKSHLVRGLFIDNLKYRLDLITGGDAQLWDRSGDATTEDAIFTDNTETRDNMWSMFGCNYTSPQDPPYGELFVGSGDESFIAGNFYIDLGVSGLSAGVITQCVNEININGGYAYFRLLLGYVNGGGAFVPYGGFIE